LTGKKGSLLHNINVIDWSAVILLAVAMSVLYPRMQKLVTRQRIPAKPATGMEMTANMTSVRSVRTEKVLLNIRFSRYTADIIRAVEVGDLDEDTDSTIIDVLSVHPVTQDLIARVNATVQVEGGVLTYRKEQLKLGSAFLFKTKKYDINGEVIFIDHPLFVSQQDYLGLPSKKVSIRVRCAGYSRELIEKIRNGDRDIRQAGTVVERVISVKPMLRTTDKGVSYRDPYRKTVIVQIRAGVNYDSEQLYYRAKPLKIGSQFLLKTSMYDMNGEVIDIE